MTDLTLYTVRQAAERLGVKPATVYAWIRQGRMRTVRDHPHMILPAECVIPLRGMGGPDKWNRPARSGAPFRGKKAQNE